VVGLWLGAPLLASAFAQVSIIQPVQALAVSLLCLALGAVPAALLQRDMRFGAVALVDGAGASVAAIVGVCLALMGYGIWALVIMEICRRAVRMVGFVAAAQWRPSFSFRAAEFSELMAFNISTLGVRLLSHGDLAIPRLVLGLMDPRALGYFNVAQRLFKQVTALVMAPFTAIALPLASAVQGDQALLKEALEGAGRAAAVIVFPIVLGLVAIMPVLIPFVLGESWGSAVRRHSMAACCAGPAGRSCSFKWCSWGLRLLWCSLRSLRRGAQWRWRALSWRAAR
jgi:O-antigen/teichoic acid export membrane protein